MGNRTGRIAVVGALLTAGALCLASSAQAAKLVASTQSATAGTQVTISVTLQTEGAMIAGTQNDLAFDATNIPVPRHCTKTANVMVTCSVDADCPPVNGVADTCSTKPACYVNPDIDKGATSFAYRGATGCSGPACGGLRSLVLSTGNVDPIPDGSVLYTCFVKVAATATGSFPLTLSGVILSDPDGQPVTPATGCNGAVNAGGNTPTPTPTGPVIDTATPTATRTATPTSQPSPPTSTPTRTNTPVPPTATRTNTPIVGPTTAPFSDDDGGCNISTTGSSSAGWLVLIPAVGLLVLRRRRR